MKNGKFAKRGVATKVMLVILAVMLVAGISVGGTLAWITAKSSAVVNTFTYGDINITLQEHHLKADGTLDQDEEVQENAYKFIPGVNLNKDPFVTVEAGSEACWLFVKVVETDWPETEKISYSVNTANNEWNALNGVAGVYYREVAASDADQDFYVLAGNKITVANTLTKTEIEAFADTAQLTFTAYAVQKEGMADAAAAWAATNA